MVERVFDVAIKGYYTDLKVGDIDDREGLYFVIVARTDENNGISFNRIIYIGQGKSIRERLSNHNKHDEFLAQCDEKMGEQIIYYAGRTGALSPENLDWCEAAIITEYENLPSGVWLLNDQHKDNYGYKTAQIKLHFASDSKNAGKSLPKIFQYTEFVVYQDKADAKPKKAK
jgi:hypothetical protein